MITLVVLLVVVMATAELPPSARRRAGEVLDHLGVRDPTERAELTRIAAFRLKERRVNLLRRSLEEFLYTRGWIPPDVDLDVGRRAVPSPASVEAKVLRWAIGRPPFTGRDVQRSVPWFECSQDVAACLEGLVARGLLETLPPLRRSATGRRPGRRYVAVEVEDAAHAAPPDREELVWPLESKTFHSETELVWPTED